MEDSGVKVSESKDSWSDELTSAIGDVLGARGVDAFLLIAKRGDDVSATGVGCENCLIQSLGAAFRSFPELRQVVEGALFLASTLDVVERRVCALH